MPTDPVYNPSVPVSTPQNPYPSAPQAPAQAPVQQAPTYPQMQNVQMPQAPVSAPTYVPEGYPQQQPYNAPQYPPMPPTPPAPPSISFSESKTGKWLKSHLYDLVNVVLVTLGFLLLFAPLYQGENLYYYTGENGVAGLYLIVIMFVLLVLLHIVEMQNLLKSYPRMLSIAITSVYGFVLGTLMTMFALWSAISYSATSRSSGYTIKNYGIEFWLYLLMFIILFAYFWYVFKKQLTKVLKLS